MQKKKYFKNGLDVILYHKWKWYLHFDAYFNQIDMHSLR